VNKPADAFVYQKTNELFVADGYGNRRVIVFDADTGAFKRMWGAFGNAPVDAPPAARGAAPAGGTPPAGRAAAPPLDTTGDGSPQFGGPVHNVKVSTDGIVYVADRPNRRIQLFDVGGTYLRQMFINRPGPSSNSVAGLAFSPDRQQRFLYVADYGNSRLLVVERATLEVLYQFGGLGEEPGRFRGPHHVAADSKGNLYVVEVSPGNRAQRFVLKGLATTPPLDALK
jgi:DNA-binding beta-propeller fold protein YncE